MILSPFKRFFISLFFEPDSNIHGLPSDHNINYEDVYFRSAGSKQLHGLFLKPSSAPRGTIIHCHGNHGNVTDHFEYIIFLVKAGYNVLTFDYAGYGQSKGSPTPTSIIEDTVAAAQYVKTREDVNPEKIILFGQSLGGAAASAAMVKDKEIKCLILEGTFTSYREMATETRIGKLLFFITPFVIPDIGPIHDLPQIAPRPILILHGESDGLIPYSFAQKLYDAAHEKKALSILKNVRHLGGTEEHPEYKERVLAFLESNIL